MINRFKFHIYNTTFGFSVILSKGGYLFILNQAMQNKPKGAYALHYHLLWLLDGTGHADSISSNLDPTEKLLIKEAKCFSKVFENLYLRSIEFSGYTRTGLSKVSDKKTLGTLAPLVLDHMNREECYYLTKLATVSKTKIPDCDPTKPRVD